jgi:hypothetical protein
VVFLFIPAVVRDLRAVLKRDGKRIVCPELGTSSRRRRERVPIL